MNWDPIEGKWTRYTGAARERWSKITADDVQTMTGQKNNLVGRIQERFGVARAEAEKQAAEWSQPMRNLLILALAAAIPIAGLGQTEETLDVTGKLLYHAKSTYSPQSLVGFAAYAGILQADGAPLEWGQGAGAYGKRFGSTLAWSGIHSALAFGLDSTLHQDPRYFRSESTGFWRRCGHAVRGTILTRTDNGGETLSTWRIGSAYGAAFLSNQWYPDRLNTARLGLIQGSANLGLDMFANLGSEFWPDIKRKVFRRK